MSSMGHNQTPDRICLMPINTARGKFVLAIPSYT
ncbi:MAG: hypothetical protein RIS90_1239 [Pseudomonadota bacterium]